MVLEKIIEASNKGAEVLRKYFGQCFKLYKKSIALDFRTRADLESEKKIIKDLSKNFPDYNILSEEVGFIDHKSKFTFVIDPLDGTSNFVMGMPNFCASIALLEEKKIIAGVVNNPILNQIYCARRGKGAYLNNKRIKVNSQKNISNINLAYDCDYGHYFEKRLRDLIKNLEKKNIKRFLINMSPALDLCRLAEGKIECFINNGNEIYDYAAGKLIVKEAGGIVTDFFGNKEADERNRFFLASNGMAIHKKVVEISSKILTLGR
ncbi:MAG: inositol monophosphatase family protein [bacterium]